MVPASAARLLSIIGTSLCRGFGGGFGSRPFSRRALALASALALALAAFFAAFLLTEGAAPSVFPPDGGPAGAAPSPSIARAPRTLMGNPSGDFLQLFQIPSFRFQGGIFAIKKNLTGRCGGVLPRIRQMRRYCFPYGTRPHRRGQTRRKGNQIGNRTQHRRCSLGTSRAVVRRAAPWRRFTRRPRLPRRAGAPRLAARSSSGGPRRRGTR